MADPFESFFADYAAAFNSFDAEALASFFHCPCMFANQEAIVVLSDRAAIHANMRALIEYHRSQHFERASVLGLRAEQQASNLAVVLVRWHVADPSGATLWEWSNSYNLCDLGEGWKIHVSTTHQAAV